VCLLTCTAIHKTKILRVSSDVMRGETAAKMCLLTAFDHVNDESVKNTDNDGSMLVKKTEKKQNASQTRRFARSLDLRRGSMLKIVLKNFILTWNHSFRDVVT